MASEKSGEDKVDTVYETIERMPFLWQESNAPIEHMLTTCVIFVFPNNHSNANILDSMLLFVPGRTL